MASPFNIQDKIRASQQLTAQEALLAAALQSHAGAATRIHGGGYFGSPQQTLLPGRLNSPFPQSHLLAAAQANDSLQELFAYQNRIQSLAAASNHQANLALLLGTGNHVLLEAASQNQTSLQNMERLQVIRQQALALTEDSPFTGRATSLRGVQPSSSLGHSLPPQAQAQTPPEQQPKPQLDRDGTLKALGSAMRTKNSPYIDASSLADPDPQDVARRRTRGGVTEPFPEKLHRMLEEVEKDGDEDIVSFFSHGRAFGVHDPERFVSKIMPRFFKQSRLSSFQRQLNLYGFVRISSGPDAGGYYHELFLKGRPALCIHMRRVGVPQGEDRRKTKSGARMIEPDFYSMKTLEETNKTSCKE